MKKVVIGIIASLALGVAATRLARAAEPAAAPAKSEAAAPAEKPKENPLHLTAAKRAAAGIVLAKPVSVTLKAEVSAFGRVLDPTPLVSLAGELMTARAALAASEKDFARLEKLHAADSNASAQAVEVAEAAVKRDRTMVASARARIIVGWGRKLADTADTILTADALEKDNAIVRIDLLAGDNPAAELKSVSVSLLGGGGMFEAEVLGPAPTADAQVQGASYLALVRNHSLPAGAVLRVTVPGPGEAKQSLAVPRTAIVYHQGSAWVFVLGEEDTFERKLVTLGQSVGENVAITSEVEDSEQVVTTGAQQLLSAELQAGGAPAEG